MSVPFWQHDQSQAARDRALLDAELHTNTTINVGGNTNPPDAFTRLLDILDRMERRLEAPHKPIPVVRSLGLLAGSTLQGQSINLPPGSAWSLDTILIAQMPGATGTFVLTFTGLLNLDLTLTSDASGIQSKSLGIPMQQSSQLTVAESGAGTTGRVGVHLIFTPL